MVESKYGSLAQLAEQETFNLKVKGSTPLRPTRGHEARGQTPGLSIWTEDSAPLGVAKVLAKELLFGCACLVSLVFWSLTLVWSRDLDPFHYWARRVRYQVPAIRVGACRRHHEVNPVDLAAHSQQLFARRVKSQ